MSDISAILGLVPGAIGGVCTVCVGHPMDLVKVRQQMGGSVEAAVPIPQQQEVQQTQRPKNLLTTQHKSPGTVTMLRTIFRNDGVKGLYAGVSAPLFSVVPAFAVTFASFEFAKQAQMSSSSTTTTAGSASQQALTIQQTAYAGGFAGITQAIIIGPTERIKCLLQVDASKNPGNQRYKSFGDAVRQVYKEGGIRSLFKGTVMTVCRDIPGNVAYFATYEYTKRQLCTQILGEEKPASVPMSITMFSGGMAGIANWIVAIPMDVIKSRYQTAEPGQYSSAAAVLRQLLRNEGPKALFRGLGPALLRAFPANAACFMGVETAEKCLRVYQER